MNAIAQALINGIAAGSIYAAVAVGFNVIYRSGRVFNIAQGEMLMLSTFMAMTFFGLGLDPWVALALTAALMAGVGLAVERVVLRRLVGQSEMALFMSTLGLLLVLNGGGIIVFGTEPRAFPDILGTARWEIGPVFVRQSALLGVLLIVVAVGALAWFFRATRTGLLMTAVAEDHQVARSLGVDVHRSISLSWAAAGVLSTVATIAYMSGRIVSPDVASIAFVALPVVLLAGLETIGGVLLGGIIVGVGQSLAAATLDSHFEGGASLVFPFILMLVVLMVRPQGLFGWKRVERI